MGAQECPRALRGKSHVRYWIEGVMLVYDYRF